MVHSELFTLVDRSHNRSLTAQETRTVQLEERMCNEGKGLLLQNSEGISKGSQNQVVSEGEKGKRETFLSSSTVKQGSKLICSAPLNYSKKQDIYSAKYGLSRSSFI